MDKGSPLKSKVPRNLDGVLLREGHLKSRETVEPSFFSNVEADICTKPLQDFPVTNLKFIPYNVNQTAFQNRIYNSEMEPIISERIVVKVTIQNRAEPYNKILQRKDL